MCLGRVAGTPAQTRTVARHDGPDHLALRCNKMALITSGCGTMRSLSIEWPESPRIARRVQVLRRVFAKEKDSNITLAIQTLDIAQVGLLLQSLWTIPAAAVS